MEWTPLQHQLRERIAQAKTPIWVCTGRSESALGFGFSTLISDVFASTPRGVYIVDTERQGAPLSHWTIVPQNNHARRWQGLHVSDCPVVAELTGTISDACIAIMPWLVRSPSHPIIIKTCSVGSREAFEKESQIVVPGVEKIVWPYSE